MLDHGDMNKHGGSAKDLFKLIIHSPALLAATLVGLVLLVYFLAKHGAQQQTATTGTTGSTLGTGGVPSISINFGSGGRPYYGGSVSQPSGAPPPPTVVPQGPPQTPTGGGSTSTGGGSTSTGGGSTGTTMTSPQTEEAIIRQRVGQLGNALGIPIRSTPGGTITGYAPYGSDVPVTGQTVNGPNNNPASGGPGSDVWYKTTNGGYVSAYDVNQLNTSSGSTTNTNVSTVSNTNKS